MSKDLNDRLQEAEGQPIQLPQGEPVPGSGSGLRVTSLADVDPEEVDWVWRDRLARGKLALLSGNPGKGKSLITMDIAARVSTGAAWPDEDIGRDALDVLLLSAEDDPGTTIRPRLDAAGADVARVSLIEAVRDGGSDRPLELDADLDRLGEELQSRPDCALVVIDPISAYLGDVNDHKNAEVRGLLARVQKLAEAHSVAVLLVSHLAKSQDIDPQLRTIGSIAFTAAVRTAFMVLDDPEDGARRILLMAKNNIGPDDRAIPYRVMPSVLGNTNSVHRIEWEDAITMRLEEVGGQNAGNSARDEAKEFLRALLKDGPVPSGEVYKQARDAGISKGTVRRAASDLEVKSAKRGFGADGRWSMALPGAETASTFEGDEHLRPEGPKEGEPRSE